eukprot:m.258095 g.258095  ORF g.258095 m.258095 type:complete len:488 (+) comp36115_c0_seq1:182-1645(+)
MASSPVTVVYLADDIIMKEKTEFLKSILAKPTVDVGDIPLYTQNALQTLTKHIFYQEVLLNNPDSTIPPLFKLVECLQWTGKTASVCWAAAEYPADSSTIYVSANLTSTAVEPFCKNFEEFVFLFDGGLTPTALNAIKTEPVYHGLYSPELGEMFDWCNKIDPSFLTNLGSTVDDNTNSVDFVFKRFLLHLRGAVSLVENKNPNDEYVKNIKLAMGILFDVLTRAGAKDRDFNSEFPELDGVFSNDQCARFFRCMIVYVVARCYCVRITMHLQRLKAAVDDLSEEIKGIGEEMSAKICGSSRFKRLETRIPQKEAKMKKLLARCKVFGQGDEQLDNILDGANDPGVLQCFDSQVDTMNKVVRALGVELLAAQDNLPESLTSSPWSFSLSDFDYFRDKKFIYVRDEKDNSTRQGKQQHVHCEIQLYLYLRDVKKVGNDLSGLAFAISKPTCAACTFFFFAHLRAPTCIPAVKAACDANFGCFFSIPNP